ncbi:MAG: type II toxin-antitoxin system RelE/ParE family toxin [Methanomicrobiaceae archaeon]|nr:type II toxin-antitoxin system RelE/ParE family toxin [Methanomicrobiaceae archaeon]
MAPRAERDFSHLNKPDKIRIRDELSALAGEAQPGRRLRKLKEVRDLPLSSLRVGHYRVILIIEDDTMVIVVIEIGDRSSIYRKH